jgi:hypothetical protein
MASGRDKTRRHDDGREADRVCDRIASGDINSGNGVSGPMNLGTGARREFHPGRQYQVGSNPGHARGRPYGRNLGGWQRRPYGGYRYGGSRLNNTDRGGGDHGVGREIPQGNLGHVTRQIPIAGGTQSTRGLGQGAAGGGTSQQLAPDSTQEPHVPDVFKAQKAGKAKVEEASTAEGKGKPFCFRCYKPGHGKLECTTKLLCEICGSTEHLTGKCPILKQPRLLAHLCGYDVSGLGFYHIPHAAITISKNENRIALVTMKGVLSLSLNWWQN